VRPSRELARSPTSQSPCADSYALKPIGIFDSGVGGLTVLKALRARLPHEDLLYFGDTARVPYGNKAPATIERYACNIARYLEDADCKAIVIACNTASAFALDAVRRTVSVPVVDVIGPVAARVADSPDNQTIAVIGTRGTVRSGAYVRSIERQRQGRRVIQQACPLFVPLAEEGWTSGPIAEAIAEKYLQPLFASEPVGHLILGCTHYPLLEQVIRSTADRYARGVQIHDSAGYTAAAIEELLEAGGLSGPRDRVGSSRFVVTDDPSAFLGVGAAFLGEPIDSAEHVDVR
jgi:glutamate racemase